MVLATINYDPIKLAVHIKSQYPEGDKLFSETESSLYNRAIELSAQYIIDLASNLPEYTSSNFTEILRRLDTSMSKLDIILDDLSKVRDTSEKYNKKKMYADFEADYRAAVVRKLDKLNLFGIDISRKLKRYQLTVAYISLEFFDPKPDEETLGERISVESALVTAENNNLLAIIGEAGSGKTTLLHWLAVNSAANKFERKMLTWQNTVPFLIELRHYVDGLPSPQNFIDRVAPELIDQMPQGWVQDALRSGRAALLVDGLDEVAPNKREAVINWLDDIIASYRKIKIVITSRPTSYISSFFKKIFNLAPMQYSSIELFVEYWHKAVLVDQQLEAEERAEVISRKLLEKLRNNLAIMRLGTNPLLCAMLCALHYDRQMQLPADRNDLYEACISMLLERRDIEREVSLEHYPQLTYKQKRVLLNDLSYWMMINGYSSVLTEDAIKRIELRLENMQIISPNCNAEKVLSLLTERSGIIREPSIGRIDFVHRTFQEYMAANAAIIEGNWGVLLSKAPDDQWQETIILAAGFANEKQANKLIEGWS